MKGGSGRARGGARGGGSLNHSHLCEHPHGRQDFV